MKAARTGTACEDRVRLLSHCHPERSGAESKDLRPLSFLARPAVVKGRARGKLCIRKSRTGECLRLRSAPCRKTPQVFPHWPAVESHPSGPGRASITAPGDSRHSLESPPDKNFFQLQCTFFAKNENFILLAYETVFLRPRRFRQSCETDPSISEPSSATPALPPASPQRDVAPLRPRALGGKVAPLSPGAGSIFSPKPSAPRGQPSPSAQPHPRPPGALPPNPENIPRPAQAAAPAAKPILPRAEAPSPSVKKILLDAEPILPPAEAVLPKTEGALLRAEGILPPAEGLLLEPEAILRRAEGVVRKTEGVLRKAERCANLGEG